MGAVGETSHRDGVQRKALTTEDTEEPQKTPRIAEGTLPSVASFMPPA